jgi:hypothetical protein
MESVGSVGLNDTAYLYRLSQSTVVDLESFVAELSGLFSQASVLYIRDIYRDWYIPSKVFDVGFDLGQRAFVSLSGRLPINLAHLPCEHAKVVYEVLQQVEDEEEIAFSTRESALTVLEGHNLRRMRGR